MAISLRRKIWVFILVLYWGAIFALTHIPAEHIAEWAIGPQIWDKMLHFAAYLILVVLLWYARYGRSQARWSQRQAWIVLCVLAGYGIFDEWLQGYCGRSCDIYDFIYDIIGVVAGLVILSIFRFDTVMMILSAGVVILSGYLLFASGA